MCYFRHSPGEGSERPSSPAYLPPSPHSPDVIDIDMEETGQVEDSLGVEQVTALLSALGNFLLKTPQDPPSPLFV